MGNKNNKILVCAKQQQPMDSGLSIKEEASSLVSAGVPFQRVTGVADKDSQAMLMYHCIAACGYMNIQNEKEDGIAKRSVLSTLESLEPQDSMEGRLIAQLFTLQERGMQLLESSQRATSTDQQNLYINMSTKLFRTANETVEMLQKWRRKGAQTVVVQHVNVEGGGKAIVGGNMVAGGG